MTFNTVALWIDISGIKFRGRSESLREEQVAEIAIFYARQITNCIPGAYIETALDRPGMAESGNLSTTCLVRHPQGVVVVSAAFTARRGSEEEVSNVVKIHVISSNFRQNGHHELNAEKVLTAETSTAGRSDVH